MMSMLRLIVLLYSLNILVGATAWYFGLIIRSTWSNWWRREIMAEIPRHIKNF